MKIIFNKARREEGYKDWWEDDDGYNNEEKNKDGWGN